MSDPAQFIAMYADLVAWVRSRTLAETNIDRLLHLARFYGQIRSDNFDGIYADTEVEHDVASKVFNNRRFRPAQVAASDADTVLIASELYDSGGHTRVILNWMKIFKAENSHTLLVTRSITKSLQKSLDANGIRYHLCSAQGMALVQEIIGYCAKAKRIVLHIHPDDIVSAIAADFVARSGKEVFFYNHADHRFSFGISTASVVCEISHYGIALNRQKKRAKRSCYLGIPIDSPHLSASDPDEDRVNILQTVLSCGASYKYAPSDVFFGSFIDALLERNPSILIQLIGPTGQEPWWAGPAQRWGNSVLFYGDLPHESYSKLMKAADVYVDSFPITGGTAFPEALLRGRLTTGIHVAVHGYSPADQLRVATVDRLARRVFELLEKRTEAIRNIEHARVQAIEIHSLSAFRNRILAIYAGKCEEIPWTDSTPIDLQWIERKWADEMVLVCNDTTHLCNLSYADLIIFLSRLYRLQRAPSRKYLRYACSRLMLSTLPRRPRALVIELISGSIERKRKR